MVQDLILKSLKAIQALMTRRTRIKFDKIPYEFQQLPFKKILNWILIETCAMIKPELPWGWPTHLMVEPTNHCNLRCVLCPVTTGISRPTGDMDFKNFKKLIDEIGDYTLFLMLWNWGEPFLNPTIYDMISYAKRRDIKIISTTNGHPFVKGDHAYKLVRSGIDSLIFALDGISQDTYEQYRRGGDLKTVIAAIKKVVAVKHALNSRNPLIDLRFIVMRHNEHEVSKVKGFAKSLGVDILTLKTLNPYNKSLTRENGNDFVPQNPFYQRFKYDLKTHLPIRCKQNSCKTLWNNSVINWDGKVSPCCYDPHNKHVLGDLTRDRFKDIWLGASYRQLRRKFRKNYQEIALCSQCTYAFEGGSFNDSVFELHIFNPLLKNSGVPVKHEYGPIPH